jgi:hypothetical protein
MYVVTISLSRTATDTRAPVHPPQHLSRHIKKSTRGAQFSYALTDASKILYHSTRSCTCKPRSGGVRIEGGCGSGMPH